MTPIGNVTRYVIIFDAPGEGEEVHVFIAESDVFDTTTREGVGMDATSSSTTDGSRVSPTDTEESAAGSSDNAAVMGAKALGAVGWTVVVGMMFGWLQAAMV